MHIVSCFQTTEADRDLVASLPEIWCELVLKSKNKDARLVVVKKKFTEVSIGFAVQSICWVHKQVQTRFASN